VDILCLSPQVWTASSIVRIVTSPGGNGTATPRQVAGGGTAPEGGDGRSFGTSAVTGPWPRVRDDRPELLRGPRGHRVGASRGAPLGSEGGCHRQKDRTTRRSGFVQTDGRPRGRPGERPRRPPPGGATGRELHRTSPAEVGTVRTRGRSRSDAIDRGPTRRGSFGATTREVGAHSRGAHPPATPRWAREGARGVRASGAAGRASRGRRPGSSVRGSSPR
jgi:hypothetical protein